MSFNRSSYDTCSYKHVVAETVGPGVYKLTEPPNTCKPCHPMDPYIRLQRGGVSVSKNANLVDIDSELIGINRNLSQCPERKYMPQLNNSAYCGAQTGGVVNCQTANKVCIDNSEMLHFDQDCFTNTEDTRLSNPPCTLRGTGWNRWEWLCQNPQDRVEVPFDFQVDSVIVAKDNHRPCIPRPINQKNAWPTPSNQPFCENYVQTCPVPTGPPSVSWQTSENLALY